MIARWVIPLGAALLLGGCGGDDPTPSPTPSPSSSPTSGATAVSYNVENCFTQVIPGTGGQTLRSLTVPDTLKLDLSQPAVFPNGRTLTDPVIDITLAFLFIDLSVSGQSTRTFANLPLNPAANDKPFSDTFPFLAPPQGTPALATTTGTSFDFRTDPDSAYTRVDRMGMPAVATALITTALKNTYNDANPSDDVTGEFRQEERDDLKQLYDALGDDLTGIGLKVCARPS